MIVVRVELHSAITGRANSVARMHISNRGTNPNPNRGDYGGTTFIGRKRATEQQKAQHRDGIDQRATEALVQVLVTGVQTDPHEAQRIAKVVVVAVANYQVPAISISYGGDAALGSHE